MEQGFFDAVEFFSGVGGWHHAIKLADLPIRVVSAYDSNEKANIAYKESFGFSPIATDLALIPASKVDALRCVSSFSQVLKRLLVFPFGLPVLLVSRSLKAGSDWTTRTLGVLHCSI